MKLIGRKALYEGTEEVTFISELYFDKGSFFIAYIDKNLHLSYDFIYSFTLIDDEQSKVEEWTPDWSKIKYDHLRMDADGKWHSFIFRMPELRYREGEWYFSTGNKFALEDHITYIHPNPKDAIYTRPKQ